LASHKNNIFLASLALILCIAGILLCMVACTNDFPSPVDWRVTQVLAGLLVAWVIISVILRRRDFVVNINISLISLAIVAPLLGEIVIRGAISLGIDLFRNPQLYSDPLNDDDYWKLRYIWNPKYLATGHDKKFVVDRLLGWSPPRTPGNPMGIVSDTPYSPSSSKPPVLFYGDSFAHGAMMVPVPQRIPQQLDRILENHTVYNFGVSAFGVDQIFLRFRETHSAFQHPLVLFGILTEDMDRSILNVHSAPKPRFDLRNGELDLQNTPIPDDSAEWYMQHPPSIKSYFLALLRRTYQTITGRQDRRLEKERINEKIIEAAVEEARVNDLPIVFVIFYGRRELDEESWREIFLKNIFEELDVPYIDTKAVLNDKAREHSMNIHEFYLYKYNNDHPNALGNCVIAAAIAEYLANNLDTEEFRARPAGCFDYSD
jgi:hypothetical protein